MNSKAIRDKDLTGKEMLEIRKYGKSIDDPEAALIYGIALMARRRAGEKDLTFDDIFDSTIEEINEWIATDQEAPKADTP